MKNKVFSFFVAVFLLFISNYELTAQNGAVSITFPFGLETFVPCADDGQGEIVALEGTLHIVFHQVNDEAGGTMFSFHAQPQRLQGRGLTTGDLYQATGGTRNRTVIRAGEKFSFVNNFKIIGQGPGNNFTVHENVQAVINANGELVVLSENVNIDCK